jgi:hypothetical protein
MIVIDDTSKGLSKAWSITYNRNHSFIVLSTVIKIVKLLQYRPLEGVDICAINKINDVIR